MSIKWEKVEHGYLSDDGKMTIVESYPGQWVATDWNIGRKEQSPRFPSVEEAKAWCEMRVSTHEGPPEPGV